MKNKTGMKALFTSLACLSVWASNVFVSSANERECNINPPEWVSASVNYPGWITVTWPWYDEAPVSFGVWHSTGNDTNTAIMVGVGTNISSDFFYFAYSYTHDGAVPYTTNYYWVKTMGASATSDFSTVACGYLYRPPAPSSVAASDGTFFNKVVVTWQCAITWIETRVFSILRSETDSPATAELVGTVANMASSSSFYDTTAETNSLYYYWVRVTTSGGLTSDFSASDEGYARTYPGKWARNDYDGDGQSDLAFCCNGRWFIYSLANGLIYNNYNPFSTYPFYGWGIPLQGDYDADGKADLALYSHGYWNIYSPENGSIMANVGPFGGADAIPIPGDYDGDGQCDLAFYRNGYWSVYSLNSGLLFYEAGPWGGPDCSPVPGDYDGDGQSDLAFYRNGYWSAYSLANGLLFYEAGPWGGPDSVLVPGDYDGDGQSDLAFYRNGYWSIYSLVNGPILYEAGQWGGSDCSPVTGDYDADGKDDLAFYRNGYWSIYLMASGVLCCDAGAFGGSGAILPPAAIAGGPPANIAGTWRGTYTMVGEGAVSVVVNFSQNAGRLSGTSFWGGSSASTVSGRLCGNYISITVDYQTSGWASDVVSGIVAGDTIMLTGSDGEYYIKYNLTRTSAAAETSVGGAMGIARDDAGHTGLAGDAPASGAKCEALLQQSGQ